jgi:hypothetical protein
MSQRAIEVIVGRLITDKAFRQAFARSPRRTVEELAAQGLSVTETEIRALVGTRVELWTEVGEQLDPDLQKANLRTDPPL